VTVHRVHTNTVQTKSGAWYVELVLNGAPCGAIGPVAIESVADTLAEGLSEGMRIAFERAQKRSR
jgi:hypothetical protein